MLGPDTPFPADVDECSAGGGGCPQHCVNTAGSYWCQCWEGHRPSVDGAVCLPERGTPRVTPDPETGKVPSRCHSCRCAWGWAGRAGGAVVMMGILEAGHTVASRGDSGEGLSSAAATRGPFAEQPETQHLRW